MLNLNKYFASALQRGQRSSALTPLLWLNSIVSVPCLVLSSRIEGPFRYVLFALGVLIVLYTLVAYGYLLRKDPRWVQSETFQLESRKLDIIAAKGEPALVASAVEISEPQLLEPGEAADAEGAPRG
jgi:hypothetical protein